MSRKASSTEITFQGYDRIAKALRNRKALGRVFLVGGVAIKLYPVGVLADAIDRKPRTIIEWEKAGLFPKPMYAVPNTNYKRWYSERQVLFCNQLWLEFRNKGKAKHFPYEEFLKRVRERFYRVDVDAAKET